MGKALATAKKIFFVIDQPSTVDASLEVEDEFMADPKTFKGEI
jgi:hypothetical protein